MHYTKRFLKKLRRDVLFDITHTAPHINCNSTIIPFVCTFHPVSQHIVSELLRNLRLLTTQDLTDVRLLRAFRRNKNLGDLIVRNKM
jgi:hypothetical protein